MGADPRVIRITDGPQPKHAQLSDVLADLAVNHLGPDAAIPSERELMSSYGVSRATVRKAIDSLVADGLLHRSHGKGTFVSRPRLESNLHLASFTQDMRRRGLVPSTRLLGVEVDRPPTDVAKALDLGGDGRAWRLDRVRYADEQPIALENGWYPHDLLPGLDRHDLSGSLYEVVTEAYGLTIDSAEQTLWGESADSATAHRLDAPLHTPLLVFRRVSRAAGTPLEYVVSRYRGDRYQLHMSLAAPVVPAAPEDAAPDPTAPDPTAPDPTAPDQTAPDQTAPDQTAPDQTAPDQTAPHEKEEHR